MLSFIISAALKLMLAPECPNTREEKESTKEEEKIEFHKSKVLIYYILDINFSDVLIIEEK